MSAVLNYLIKKSMLSPEDLRALRDKRFIEKKSIQALLIEQGAITEQGFFNVARKVSPFLKIDLKHALIDPQAVRLIALERAVYHGAFPIREENGFLLVAMSDPSDFVACDEIGFITNLNIRPVLCIQSQIAEYIEKFYRTDVAVQEILKDTLADSQVELPGEETLAKDDIADLTRTADDDSSLIRLVSKILCDAVRNRASDVHIEPQEKVIDVRYRIDGSLKSALKIPRELQSRLVTRVKILAQMDIAERRKVQEGRVKAILGDEKIDLRVSLIPLIYGEKIVLRILGNQKTKRELHQLGFERPELNIFKEAVQKTQGVVLVTGPTGSGKTTTLYAALEHIKNESINIVTIEDPIEYLIDGINQMQLSRHKDVTFANGLRNILRQDPDVILVGEIRDAETAGIAFQAALTGHLVFSTLHTNNAVSSITRLMNIGIEPYLIVSSLTLLVAQRLVRLICPDCRQEYIPEEKLLAKFENHLSKSRIQRFYQGKGCTRCHFSGFYGRSSIFEIVKIDETIQNLILNKMPENVILKKALDRGMRTLLESGITKVANGLTTLEEVAKVADIHQAEEETDVPLGCLL